MNRNFTTKNTKEELGALGGLKFGVFSIIWGSSGRLQVSQRSADRMVCDLPTMPVMARSGDPQGRWPCWATPATASAVPACPGAAGAVR
ncbi:MAG: hypothetical protein DRI37_08305 [Chloroflexi bacterium]|nr:MAG: hypothetical protein DRI37_08305 [Chloroflexota bacterium]